MLDPTFFQAIRAEVDKAYTEHGRDPWGRHEFYGVIAEEFDELWDAIKSDAPQEDLMLEVIQVAAMCLRYFETNDRYRGTHPSITSLMQRRGLSITELTKEPPHA